MTNIDICIMYSVAWGTFIAILYGLLFSKEISWVRFVPGLILGAILGSLLSNAFAIPSTTKMHVIIGICYVVSFILTCTSLIPVLFKKIPKKARKVINIALIVLLVLAVLVTIIVLFK
jgi:multisubunit Na+/H+ antiporter MnhE subunit